MPNSLDPRIPRALALYTSDHDLAFDYDSYYEGLPLLGFDTEIISHELAGRSPLLDIGCGTGRHLVALAEGRRCIGMDLSAPMLEMADAKVRDAGLSPLLVRADMRAPLPFRDASFGAVICMFSTMGLIPSSAERVAFVREVSRVLAPGGLFALHVHNRLYNLVSGWGRLWLLKTYTYNRLFTSLEVGDRIMRSYRCVPNMYLHVFSLGEVLRLVSQAGLARRRTVLLNDDRTGELKGFLASVRANGFIVVAEKPQPAA